MKHWVTSGIVFGVFLALFFCLPVLGRSARLTTFTTSAQTPRQSCIDSGMQWCDSNSTCVRPGGLCTRTCQDSGTGNLNLINCYKLNVNDNVGAVFDSPATLVNLLVRVAFIAAGMVVFIMIIYAGFLTLSGGVKGQEQAATVFGTAITGLIVMFVAFWIVQVIKIVTGADILL